MIYSATVNLHVDDLDRSLGFYTEVLDFVFDRRLAGGAALLHGPGIAILLEQRKRPRRLLRRRPPPGVSIGLWTNDLAATRQRLSSRGVVFEDEIIQQEDGKLSFLRDPDGTPITLIQMLF